MFAWEMLDYSRENHAGGVRERHGWETCLAVQQIGHPVEHARCRMVSTSIHTLLVTQLALPAQHGTTDAPTAAMLCGLDALSRSEQQLSAVTNAAALAL